MSNDYMVCDLLESVPSPANRGLDTSADAKI